MVGSIAKRNGNVVIIRDPAADWIFGHLKCYE